MVWVHNDDGHTTVGCKFLQNEVDYLLKKGYLKKVRSEKKITIWPKQRRTSLSTIAKMHSECHLQRRRGHQHHIHNYKEVYQGLNYSWKRRRETLIGDYITFNDEDVDEFIFPYHEPFVINLWVSNIDIDIKCVLVDSCISINIMHLWFMEEMQMTDQIIPKARIVFVFNSPSEITHKKIILPTFAEGKVKDTLF